jgi:hypothetical protein
MPPPSATTTPRFLISISFAGEIRPFIHDVAQRLAELFGQEKVLYDQFHEAEFSRARLNRYLPKLYHDETELVVAVFSSDYPDREWCGLEWDALFDLISNKKESKVMLSRFNHAMPEGLYGAGFSELDGRSVDDCVRLILERLAHNQSHPRSHYTQHDPRYQGMSTVTPLQSTVQPPPPPPPDPKRVLEVFGELFEPLKRILDENNDLRLVLAKAYKIEIPKDTTTDTDFAGKLLVAFHDDFLQAIAEFTVAVTTHKVDRGPVLEAFAAMIYLGMCPEVADELKRNPERRVFTVSEDTRQGIAKMIVTWSHHGGKKPLPIDQAGKERMPEILKITPQMTVKQGKDDLMRRYGIDPKSPSAALDLDFELSWRKRVNDQEIIFMDHEEGNDADDAVLKALEDSPELKHAFIVVRLKQKENSTKATLNPYQMANEPAYDGHFERALAKILLLRQEIESTNSANS